ncbi:MAG: tautomerase family protein [Acidobacteriota bacterium]
MPIYLSTLGTGRADLAQRRQIAECITEVHVDVTGAPIQFVNVFFSDQADEECGFREVPQGKAILVSGGIRAGRTPEQKAEMVERITRGAADALGCDAEEVVVTLVSGSASNAMENGQILPEPGSPEEQAWKELSSANLG